MDLDKMIIQRKAKTHLRPSVRQLNPVLAPHDPIVALVLDLRRLETLGVDSTILVGKRLGHYVLLLHIGLLVGLQLILLLFRLIMGGHFIWLLIWTLLVRPCRLIGVNPVLVDQISLVGIFGKCQSWGEEEGKGTKPGQAHKRCLCWCEGKGWTGLEVVARVEVVTSRGPAHLPTTFPPAQVPTTQP